MRYMAFTSRNVKELLRDPLSYIFCLGLPVLMLVIMTLMNSNIPSEAQMTIFNIENLGPGIAIFSFSFVMLFACLQVSKDRYSSFLIRLYASPMTAFDFIAGYTIPLLLIALGQVVITFAASSLIGLITGTTFNLFNMIISALTLVPAVVLFIGFGLLFGSLFNDKVAPPISSIVITLASIMGGIWMDVNMLGGTLKSICTAFPFYHATQAARAALSGNYSDILTPLMITGIYAIAIYAVAVLVFKRKMQSDIS